MTRKLVGTHLRSLLLTNFVRQQWQDDPIRMVTGFHPNNLKYLTTLALERKRIRIDEFNYCYYFSLFSHLRAEPTYYSCQKELVELSF